MGISLLLRRVALEAGKIAWRCEREKLILSAVCAMQKQQVSDALNKRINKYGSQENVMMRKEDWERRWKNRHIGFHKTDIHPDLIKHENVLLSAQMKSRILIPCCGKTLDMIYLADKGHAVVGVDICEAPIQEFFNENNLKYTAEELSAITRYQAIGKDITLYSGNFLKLDRTIAGQFDAVWDRGSFVAMNPNQRGEYVKVMITLLKPEAKYLLNTVYFVNPAWNEPPHSVSDEDLDEYFGKSFNVQHLDKYNGMHRLKERTQTECVVVRNTLLTIREK